MSDSKEIEPSLLKKLLFPNNPKIRITNEALEAAIFLLKRFITEARYRASVEAEFDTDNDGSVVGSKRLSVDDDDSIDRHKSNKKRKVSGILTRNNFESCSDDDDEEDDPVVIRAKHVLKISAEMLLDFA